MIDASGFPKMQSQGESEDVSVVWTELQRVQLLLSCARRRVERISLLALIIPMLIEALAL